MSYRVLNPPFSLRFGEMSKKELREYAAWFQKIIPERVEDLARYVTSTPGFESWKPDCSVASLKPLGAWFAGKVETRPRTAEEIQAVLAGSPYPIDVPAEDLTDETFSLAFDIGLYLSQVFLAAHPQLRWEQPLGSKRHIDYGQPVLIGFGKVPFNPVRMVITFAYSLARGSRGGEGLHELFDIWSRKVDP